MIAGIFHQGSGIGNQLHRYVATRVLAEDKGYGWGMGNPSLFKGKEFMELDMGTFVPEGIYNRFEEKKVVENGVDIRSYDPEFNFIQDNTIIDGEFQDERYFSHRLKEIDQWLKVKPLRIEDNTVTINYRGGEYTCFPDLYLTKEYWEQAINHMKGVVFNPRFEVHTDDVLAAKAMLGNLIDATYIHDVGINWRSIRHAKLLILSNSSFAILPALLSPARVIIAPRYWARRNTGVWALPQNYYSRFQYL